MTKFEKELQRIFLRFYFTGGIFTIGVFVAKMGKPSGAWIEQIISAFLVLLLWPFLLGYFSFGGKLND